jgi:hypothetical protein
LGFGLDFREEFCHVGQCLRRVVVAGKQIALRLLRCETSDAKDTA